MGNEILLNIDRVHTTELGAYRIKKNLKLEIEAVVKYCKIKIQDNTSYVFTKKIRIGIV